MFKLACKIPDKVTVACSGGVDSMVLLHFVHAGRRDITVAHFNHGTPYGHDAQALVEAYTNNNNLKLKIGKISSVKPDGESPEKFWRDERYSFFKGLPKPILTAHHLNDTAEWWLMSALRGRSGLIPVSRNNGDINRPLLFSTKAQIIEYATRHAVPFVSDPTNMHTSLPRGIVRNEIMDLALKANPGFLTTVRNLYRDRKLI